MPNLRRVLADWSHWFAVSLNLGLCLGNLVDHRYSVAGLQAGFVALLLIAGWTFDRFRVWFDTQIKKLDAERAMAERANQLMEDQMHAMGRPAARVTTDVPRKGRMH